MDLTRRQALRLMLAVVVALGVLVALDQAVERLSPWDYDDFERWMEGLGAWGPVIYVLFFAASMVIAPIPTTPAPLVAAAAWGAAAGLGYTLLGGAIGASVAFWIARRWGRGLYERFLPAKVVAQIDGVAERLALRALIGLRLFPVLGVDVVSYAAGLTGIRYRTYLVVSVVFSVPALVLVSVIGEGIQEDRTLAVVGVGALAAFLLAPLLYFALRKPRGGGGVDGAGDARGEGGAREGADRASAPSTEGDASRRRQAGPP